MTTIGQATENTTCKTPVVNGRQNASTGKSKVITAGMHISKVDNSMLDTFNKIDSNHDKTVTADEIKQFKEGKNAQVGFGTMAACAGGAGLAAASAYTGAAAVVVAGCGGVMLLCGAGLVYCGFKALSKIGK